MELIDTHTTALSFTFAFYTLFSLDYAEIFL